VRARREIWFTGKLPRWILQVGGSTCRLCDAFKRCIGRGPRRRGDSGQQFRRPNRHISVVFGVQNDGTFEIPPRDLKTVALKGALAWCFVFRLVVFATYFWRFGGSGTPIAHAFPARPWGHLQSGKTPPKSAKITEKPPANTRHNYSFVGKPRGTKIGGPGQQERHP